MTRLLVVLFVLLAANIAVVRAQQPAEQRAGLNEAAVALDAVADRGGHAFAP